MRSRLVTVRSRLVTIGLVAGFGVGADAFSTRPPIVGGHTDPQVAMT